LDASSGPWPVVNGALMAIFCDSSDRFSNGSCPRVRVADCNAAGDLPQPKNSVLAKHRLKNLIGSAPRVATTPNRPPPFSATVEEYPKAPANTPTRRWRKSPGNLASNQ